MSENENNNGRKGKAFRPGQLTAAFVTGIFTIIAALITGQETGIIIVERGPSLSPGTSPPTTVSTAPTVGAYEFVIEPGEFFDLDEERSSNFSTRETDIGRQSNVISSAEGRFSFTLEPLSKKSCEEAIGSGESLRRLSLDELEGGEFICLTTTDSKIAGLEVISTSGPSGPARFSVQLWES